MKFLSKVLLAAVAATPDASIFATAAGECTCSSYYGAGNATKPLDVNVPQSYGNVALEMMHIALATIDGTRGEPHKIAMVAAAMWEAYATITGNIDPILAGSAGSSTTCDDVCEDEIVKAGYFALKMVLTGDAVPSMLRRFDKLALVDAKLKTLGYDCTELPSSPVMYVGAILMNWNIFASIVPFEAANPPSSSYDADCSYEGLDNWQAQCVQGMAGEECKAQMIPFLPLNDKTLISTNLANIESVLGSNFGGFGDAPSSYTDEDGARGFVNDHISTLEANGALTDIDKFNAEYFAPNGAVLVQQLTLDELQARESSLEDSIVLLFSVGAAVRDAIIGAVTMKLTYDTIRPITALQCADKYAFGGSKLSREVGKSMGWGGPYQGNVDLGEEGAEYRPYIQTPPFPGYPSGHSVAAGAAAAALENFFDDGVIQGGNCAAIKAGGSMIEPKILKVAAGYIEGVTDVPNEGVGTGGYSPANDLEICWSTFDNYSSALSDSRLAGGIHIPTDNSQGIAYGRAMGEHFNNYVEELLSD